MRHTQRPHPVFPRVAASNGKLQRMASHPARNLAFLLLLLSCLWPRHMAMAKQITLGFVLPDLQNPIFVPMRSGAQDAAKKFGFTLRLVGPQTSDVQGQIAL